MGTFHLQLHQAPKLSKTTKITQSGLTTSTCTPIPLGSSFSSCLISSHAKHTSLSSNLHKNMILGHQLPKIVTKNLKHLLHHAKTMFWTPNIKLGITTEKGQYHLHLDHKMNRNQNLHNAYTSPRFPNISTRRDILPTSAPKQKNDETRPNSICITPKWNIVSLPNGTLYHSQTEHCSRNQA